MVISDIIHYVESKGWGYIFLMRCYFEKETQTKDIESIPHIACKKKNQKVFFLSPIVPWGSKEPFNFDEEIHLKKISTKRWNIITIRSPLSFWQKQIMFGLLKWYMHTIGSHCRKCYRSMSGLWTYQQGDKEGWVALILNCQDISTF